MKLYIAALSADKYDAQKNNLSYRTSCVGFFADNDAEALSKARVAAIDRFSPDSGWTHHSGLVSVIDINDGRLNISISELKFGNTREIGQ